VKFLFATKNEEFFWLNSHAHF
jgi:hypothetical protein